MRCLSSYVKQLINHSFRSDPSTTGGLPGHHVNESIRCVLAHEVRPNEKCLNPQTQGNKGKSLLSSWCCFLLNAEWSVGGQISFSSLIPTPSHFLTCWLSLLEQFPIQFLWQRWERDVMNWAWSCLLYKLLMFPHRPLLLCNQQISITHTTFHLYVLTG